MSNQFINQVLQLTNQERTKRGLKALKLNNKLTSAADDHSNSMAEDDFFSHRGQDGSSVGDRVRDNGYQYRTVGENIAAGYSTASAVVTGWMNSSGHRANILNPNYTEIGIGYEFLANDTGSVNYNHYWTQVFGSSLNNNNSDPLTGSNDNDRIFGTTSDDSISGKRGQDYLKGNDGNDVIKGGRGADTLLGGNGNDKLFGGKDNDILNGNSGSNILVGGSGADTFVIDKNGIDKIRDFELGVDNIRLGNGMSFNNIEIRGGNNNSSLFHEGTKFAVLINTNSDDLTSDNFSNF